MSEPANNKPVVDISNPPSWQEVDGVQLPPITWVEASPVVPRDQFGRRYLHDSRGRFIGLDRRS